MRLSWFGATLLAIQVLLAIARTVRKDREESERGAAEVVEPAPELAGFAARGDGEVGLPTRIAVGAEGDTTLSPLTLTGGQQLLKESSPAAAAGKFERPRRTRRTRPEPVAEAAPEVASVEPAAIHEVGGAVVFEAAAAAELGDCERCGDEDQAVEVPGVEVPADRAEPVEAAPTARATPRMTRPSVRGRVWRRALTRAAITCPCPTCSGLLLLFKNVARGDASPAVGRAAIPPRALAAGSSDFMQRG